MDLHRTGVFSVHPRSTVVFGREAASASVLDLAGDPAFDAGAGAGRQDDHAVQFLARALYACLRSSGVAAASSPQAAAAAGLRQPLLLLFGEVLAAPAQCFGFSGAGTARSAAQPEGARLGNRGPRQGPRHAGLSMSARGLALWKRTSTTLACPSSSESRVGLRHVHLVVEPSLVGGCSLVGPADLASRRGVVADRHGRLHRVRLAVSRTQPPSRRGDRRHQQDQLDQRPCGKHPRTRESNRYSGLQSRAATRSPSPSGTGAGVSRSSSAIDLAACTHRRSTSASPASGSPRPAAERRAMDDDRPARTQHRMPSTTNCGRPGRRR